MKLGGSSPQSGAAASYKALPAASKAYFDELNAKGGVKMGDGVTRKIDYLTLDDAYDPARTVKNVRKLVEEDGVFTMFQSAGTSPILAVLDYTTQKGVPILFSITGSNDFPQKVKDGALFAAAMLPQFSFENSVMFEQIEQINPSAKVAVLYANDAQGKGNLGELEKFAEGTGLDVVASESYEQTAASVDSQMTTLKNSGADVLVLFATGAFVTQALKKANELQWNPEKFVVSASTDTGTYLAPAGPGAAEKLHSVTWLRDVSSSALDDQPGMKAWRAFAERNKATVNGKNAIAAMGYNNAQLMVEVLKQTKGCERADVLKAAQELKGVSTDLGLDGISFGSGSDYPFAITSVVTMTFKDGHWVNGDVVTKAGR